MKFVIRNLFCAIAMEWIPYMYSTSGALSFLLGFSFVLFHFVFNFSFVNCFLIQHTLSASKALALSSYRFHLKSYKYVIWIYTWWYHIRYFNSNIVNCKLYCNTQMPISQSFYQSTDWISFELQFHSLMKILIIFFFQFDANDKQKNIQQTN